MYFSTAQALARGQGYIMPSLPGTPRQTKYPPLYPWLLSWVWRWNPSFPDNLSLAVAGIAVLACWYLIVTFLWLRRLEGIGPWLGLVITGLCAFHTSFLALSRTLMSEVPFMAFAMTAALLADGTLRPGTRDRRVIMAALVAGATVLVRTAALALIAGFVAAAWKRRAWRQVLLFSLLGGLCSAPALWLAASPSPIPETVGPAGPGFREGWLYYTSYLGFWKLHIPDARTYGIILATNLGAWLLTPSVFCLALPGGGGESWFGTAFSAAVAVGIFAGITREARKGGWQPIHFAFLFYSALMVAWYGSIMQRAMLLFLPLFYVGLITEAKYIATRVWLELRQDGWTRRAPAAFMGLILGGVSLLAFNYYFSGDRPNLLSQVEGRTALAAGMAELHAWIEQHTRSDTRFVSHGDVLLYLHTGRQAMRPLVLYDTANWPGQEVRTERQLDHLTDTARAIGARYWVMFRHKIWADRGPEAAVRHVEKWQSVLPEAFRSKSGDIEVFELQYPGEILKSPGEHQ
jgi:hypothetical protein